MAGFDAFEDNFDQQNFNEDDPAADFLAREQDELAALDDDDAYMVNGGDNEIGIVSYDDFADMSEPQLIMNGPDENILQQEQREIPIMQQPPKVREEPEKIRKWREEQKRRLEEKDIEEEKKKDELRASARKELEEWYKHHEEQIEKTQNQNRSAEKEYVMNRDAGTAGQEWEKIAKLCDFNPKSSKSTKDVSRMRSIILQLKQTPLVR